MRGLLIVATAVALSGCTSLLTAQNSQTVVAQSTSSSESTYRKLLPVLRECFPTGPSIESNYFPDAKEGEIMLVTVADGSMRIELLKLSIAPNGNSSTVTMIHKTDFPKFGAALPQWIAGKDAGCPYGTRVESPYPSHNPFGSAETQGVGRR